ncbi:MAG: ATP-binding cassette domain-containing protein [Xanthomonadales bacterium PRO7]|jgi:ATP-binding cassette subfamily F protein 3|nr:ATP-binding cassette domain-containing protein [Xanthomonadales bacterium PRO7]HMM58440.1 ATP-binding cassette domain-containing protein [Rudaea sp.]
MIRFDRLTLRRGPQVLLENVDLALHAGWRVGISGRNGAGKSSLLALVAGELAPDAGHFERPANWSMAWVRQEVPALETTALDYVLDGDAELRAIERELVAAEDAHDGMRIAHLHERLHTIGGYAAPARAGALLHGLGFKSGDETRSVAQFSGGWRMRLNLAQALMCRSDLLLLDEPTNHLDLDAVLWLQDWLSKYPGTLLLISHDREFLDAVVTHVLSIADRRADLFAGDLTGFERKRAEQLAQQSAAFEKQQRERAHLQRFVDRFRAQATKARQAQSRIKALERMVDIAPIRAASTIQFEFREPARLPAPLLKLDDAAAGYGERHVLDDITLILAPGDRIALLGANGAGKSTLVKLLAGEIAPLAGERISAKDLAIGYFAQHQLEQLDPAASPVAHLLELNPALGEKAARDFLGGFGFAGERALEPVAPFSGGEKARLCLALTVFQRPNLLLLDEPTNHLDLDMREALTEALNDFAGAVVLVSHDRALIRACCDTLLHVGGGCVAPYSGDLDDYARQVMRAANAPAQTSDKAASGDKRQGDRRARADDRARTAPLKQEVQRLEKRIAQVESDKRQADAALNDPELYEDSSKARVQELTRQASSLASELADLEARWLTAHEELEAASG